MRVVDITGKRFGKWTVIEKSDKCDSGSYWLCRCDCGTEKLVSSYSLRHGKSFSCGCNRKDIGKDKVKDLTGKRFTRLLVLERNGSDENGRAIWKCQCDCGNITNVLGKNLLSGRTKSCGCYIKDIRGKSLRTHGMRHTSLYKKWACMKTRCYNPATKSYSNYGARGIKVCDEWKNSFEAFRDWAVNNGYDESLTLDRIDYNGDYTPDNCRWITSAEQQNNKSTNVWITIGEETKTMAEWCRVFHLDYGMVNSRHQNGWPDEKLFIPPLKNYQKKEGKWLDKKAH